MTETHKETGVSGFEIKVKNISWDAKQEDVEAFLKSFTSVEQVKLLVNRKTNRSKGYAYATLTDQAALDKALSHTALEHLGRTLQILQAKPQGEKTEQQVEQQKLYQQKQTSLYVGNLSSTTTEQQVRDLFAGYGEVKSVKLVTLRKDESKVYGFVDFNDNETVQKALQLDGHNLNGNELQVKYKRQQQRRPNRNLGGQRRPRGGDRDRQPREDRQPRQDRQPREDRDNRTRGNNDARPRGNNDNRQRRNDRDYNRNDNNNQRGDGQRRQYNNRGGDRNQGQQQQQQDSSSIYVGNLDFHTDEQTLREVFSSCGQIDEVRIVRNRESGRSKGFGFINFSNANGAKNALNLNGEDVDGRQIKVDLQSSRQQQGGERQERPRNNYYQDRDGDDNRRREGGYRGNRGDNREQRRGGNRGDNRRD